MNENFLLGVDGGGTKTDFGLFTPVGECIEYLNTGSRSHEILPRGFVEVEEKLLQDLTELFSRHHIDPTDVTAAFGLAGIDTPQQRQRMENIIAKMNFADFVVSNDSVLGIKAGCPSGIGICSINGTGTVASGINENGEILQIGGIGMVTGDYAGGPLYATLTLNAVYNYFERCGEYTVMIPSVMKLMRLNTSSDLIEKIHQKFLVERSLDQSIIKILMKAADEGDTVAVDIVKKSAKEMAKSVSGCILKLNFNQTPEIVLAGSIWTKVKNPLMLHTFVEYVFRYCGRRIEPIVLEVLPMVGAAIWAFELGQKKAASQQQRENIIKNINQNQFIK